MNYYAFSERYLFLDNPTSVELGGKVGCCNLLVRAVQLHDKAVDKAGESCWCFVAQELRPVDKIDGSVMEMILTHRPAETSAADMSSSPSHQSFSVQNLLKQFPSMLPASLPLFLNDPSTVPAMHGLYV